MGVPHITSFCWCMGLEVGSRCVGFMHLVVSAILLIVVSIFAEDARAQTGTAGDLDGLYSKLHKVAVTVAVVTVVHVILAITLIVSVIKRNTIGLRVWVYVMSLLALGALLCVLILCAMYGFSATGSDIFISFLEGLVFFGILGYCILCVNSYYLMLKSAEDMEGPNKSSYPKQHYGEPEMEP
ncbi:uncharacterized protein LOC142977058 [Anticarsia gemmatalis]|uniref:uncharacterized protein LOC142977058 n=1 Tax=Anticarsia gemmatalis TaxID=129554 RepID=UPI003F772569